MDAAKDFMRLEQESSRERLSLREIVLQKPRCFDFPLPPSPLGLSNYDALDFDNIFDEQNDEDVDKVSAIYSDFNIMNPTSASEGDDYDYLDALDGISPQDLPDAPPAPPEESIAEMLREDGKGESIFVRVRV